MQHPLADLLRPQSLNEVVGQDHLVGKDGFLTRLIENDRPLSILLHGPSGCGKTTIARLYAKAFSAHFHTISGAMGSVSELKKLVQEATPLFDRTVLFADEIHRFNRAQQDAFLPYVETGKIILVGATTENPSLNLNSALLSRLRVLNLQPLDETALEKLIQRYEAKRSSLPLDADARTFMITLAQGDGRYLLNLIENIVSLNVQGPLKKPELVELLQARSAHYDKSGDGHYNLISALHKAVRGSDVDAALYWLARMLAGGEDPLFLCRRLIRMASEDIGLADPHALTQALHAKETYEALGSPEGDLALAQATAYMALAPKSNALYTAYGKAKTLAEQTTQHAPPLFALNAPTSLMRAQGFGKDYQYDHDTPEGCAGQDYFPPKLKRCRFYHPTPRGFEEELKRRLQYFEELRTRHAP